MTARNEYIEKLVQRNHANLFINRKLSVFCVSNKAYSYYRRLSRVHELPIKGSGIPALRSHCHKIPAQAQFRISHHFLTVTLKGFVQRVQLWLAGGSQETMPNDATVQRLLDTLTRDLKRVYTHTFLHFQTRSLMASRSQQTLFNKLKRSRRILPKIV